MEDSNLLFLVSQPRSGSTLLQSILSNNEFVNTTSEPWLLLPYLSVFNPYITTGVYNSELAKIGIEDYLSKLNINDYFKDQLKLFLLRIYQPLLKVHVKYVLDKTPRYYEILDLIVEYFPNAKVIVLKRNPFAVLNSIIQTWDVKNLKDLNAYKRDILNAPFLIQEFLYRNRDNKNIKEVYYEDIVQAPERQIPLIFNWLNIEYRDSVLNYKVNDKIKGYMGDKVGVEKFSKIAINEEEGYQSIKKSKIWEQFFFGYSQYLYKYNLKDFDRYKIEKKSTRVFNDFLAAVEIQYFDKNRWSLKNIYRIGKFKVKDKIYSYS